MVTHITYDVKYMFQYWYGVLYRCTVQKVTADLVQVCGSGSDRGRGVVKSDCSRKERFPVSFLGAAGLNKSVAEAAL